MLLGAFFGPEPSVRIDERRVGADGFAEYRTAQLERSHVFSVVVPEGCSAGASLRLPAGDNKRHFWVQVLTPNPNPTPKPDPTPHPNP